MLFLAHASRVQAKCLRDFFFTQSSGDPGSSALESGKSAEDCPPFFFGIGFALRVVGGDSDLWVLWIGACSMRFCNARTYIAESPIARILEWRRELCRSFPWWSVHSLFGTGSSDGRDERRLLPD